MEIMEFHWGVMRAKSLSSDWLLEAQQREVDRYL